MNQRFFVITLSALLVVLAGLALARTEFPKTPSAPVVDLAEILSPTEEDLLVQRLTRYRDTTSTEVAILTVRSLDGVPVEDFAHEVFSTWKIGKAKEDNGVLLLVAVEDRKIRIEVGYGLEGALTDAESNRIISRNSPMAAEFRSGSFGRGFVVAVEGIIQAISSDYVVAEEPNRSDPLKKVFTLLFIAIAVIVLISILSAMRGGGGSSDGHYVGRRGYRDPGFRWMGGLGGLGGLGGFGGSRGGGGGFGGFSGGFSGGGGASGGW